MRTLMVASTGGHLTELHALRHRMQPAADSLIWVTFDTPQSRAMLAGEAVHMIPPVPPRDYAGVIAAVRPARRLIRDSGAERVISTGAAVALAFLPAARRAGCSAHYIESAARTTGPSTTGRILQRMRAGNLYTQHPEWAAGRWHYSGSVFDGMRPVPGTGGGIGRVLVTLGTSPFAFPRLVERLKTVVPAHADVVWQLGSTADVDVPGHVVRSLGHDELLTEMVRADVVISHAGVGSALAALSVGKCPVLVPRLAAWAEHVDDHQTQIARELSGRRLAVMADASLVGLEHLEAAAAVTAHAVQDPPAFQLQDLGSARRAGGAVR